MLTPEDGAYKRVEHQGVDPARTIVVTIPRTGQRPDLAEATRLAEILLRDLAVGSGSLGSAFITALDAVDTDPLLKLYGALVALSRLARDASPALDEAWPTGPAEQNEFRVRWRKLAANWLAAVSEKGVPPDLVSASWRLQAEGEEVIGRFGSLSRPPMLECAWRWAVARSARDPKAVPRTASFRAAARTAGGTAPWLSWRPAAAKAQIAPVPAGSKDTLDTLMGKVAERVRLTLDNQTSASVVTMSDPLYFLSPDAQAMAFSVLHVTDSCSFKRGGDREMDPVKELAARFGAPAPQLRRRLIRTLSELDAIQPTAPKRPSGEGTDFDPPAMRRMIIYADDPNKGRFGGRQARGGCELRAEFKLASNKNWVRVTLTVVATLAVPKDAIAEFFLHDSFRPNRITATFQNGEAMQAVTSWGGFTVGAWIPFAKAELELDLAGERGAPRIIRER